MNTFRQNFLEAIMILLVVFIMGMSLGGMLGPMAYAVSIVLYVILMSTLVIYLAYRVTNDWYTEVEDWL